MTSRQEAQHPMTAPGRHRYAARFAETAADVDAAQRLRYRAFRARPGAADAGGRDADAFDAICRHLLVEEHPHGALVGCLRLLAFADGTEIAHSYAAQFYDLTALAAWDAPMAELGRVCVEPGRRDPDILRRAWAAVARFVETSGTVMLFGCSSFQGAEVTRHRDALAMLAAHYLAPSRWAPGVCAPEAVSFADALAGHAPDPRRARTATPPLLQGYLRLGGRVSDHAVIDRDLDTLHVFTGLEVAAIPEASRRSLREGAAEPE